MLVTVVPCNMTSIFLIFKFRQSPLFSRNLSLTVVGFVEPKYVQSSDAVVFLGRSVQCLLLSTSLVSFFLFFFFKIVLLFMPNNLCSAFFPHLSYLNDRRFSYIHVIYLLCKCVGSCLDMHLPTPISKTESFILK